jgi:hypothetical protein
MIFLLREQDFARSAITCGNLRELITVLNVEDASLK